MNETYTRRLIGALQAREIPPDRVGEVIAEVESHVATTGEDPTDAFGTPAEYAAAIAPQPPRARSIGFAWLCGGVTGWMVATTIVSLADGDDRIYRMPPWLAVVVCLALIALTAGAAGRQRPGVRDPRDGRRRSPSGAVGFTAVIAVLVAVVAVVAALTV